MGGMKDAIERSPEEIKNALEGRSEETPEQEYDRLESDPKMKVQFEFEIDYTDKRGKRWHGKFTNRILSYQLESHVGAMRAQLAGGMPIEALDNRTLVLNRQIAHLTWSLVKRPKWAEGDRLAELYDPKIRELIWAEVVSHENTFHGSQPDPEDGEG